MPVLVLGAFYSLTHLIASSHIGSWMVEEGDGFPGVRQLVTEQVLCSTQAVPACRGCHGMSASAFLPCPAHLLQPFCCSLLSSTRQHPCLPSVLAAISRHGSQFISPHRYWLLHTLLHFHISHVLAFSLIGISLLKRPNDLIVLWFLKIFA